MRFRWLSLCALAGSLLSSQASAEDAEVKVSGLVFGDYFYTIADQPHGDPAATVDENANGVWLRRIYLGFDGTLNDWLSSRVRLEVASPGAVDAGSAGRLSPVLKDASLTARLGDHQISIGLQGTPTFATIENAWGYRAVEKTPTDFHKFGPSRDLGLGLKGSFLDKAVRYHFTLGNGNSNTSENNKGKMAALSLGVYPIEGLLFELYGDLSNFTLDGQETFTAQAFLAYEHEYFRVGAQFTRQDLLSPPEGIELDPRDLVSLFAVGKLSEMFSLLARWDHSINANPKALSIAYLTVSDAAPYHFVLAGVDIAVAKNFKIVPNAEMVFYSDNAGAKPDPDVVGRVTFFWEF